MYENLKKKYGQNFLIDQNIIKKINTRVFNIIKRGFLECTGNLINLTLSFFKNLRSSPPEVAKKDPQSFSGRK